MRAFGTRHRDGVPVLKTRIYTALVMLAVFVVVFVVLPAPWFAVALAIVVAACGWEWSRLCVPDRAVAAVVYGGILGLACATMTWRAVPSAPLLVLAVLMWCLAPLLMRQWSARASTPAVAGLILGFFVIVPGYLALVALRQWADGRGDYLWMLLLLVWAADTGAYAFGRRFGRNRLAPRISPGKTWEGLAGGLACAAGLGLVAVWVFPGGVPMAILPWLGVCVATALLSAIGDLTESLFKRMAGVKDSGRLLPGHGGLLDRFDGVFAAAPVFAVGVWILQSTTAESLW